MPSPQRSVLSVHFYLIVPGSIWLEILGINVCLEEAKIHIGCEDTLVNGFLFFQIGLSPLVQLHIGTVVCWKQIACNSKSCTRLRWQRVYLREVVFGEYAFLR